MKNPERIAALNRFGYDDSEAEFLVMAALHGGYFLRRQFLAFIGGTKGWKDVVLLKKLAHNEHCKATVYRHDRIVYHLSSKPIYDAFRESDNRNRREHQPTTVKNKIMSLDFVLQHPAGDYLSTEQEKWDYFVRTRNIATESLPTRTYASPRGHGPTAKHFVEAYPIFLLPQMEPIEMEATQPHFCYIDEGLQSTDRFATYLKQYGELFAALRKFQVIYVAESSRLFASAERVFQKFASSALTPRSAGEPEQQRLLAYFRKRRLYEKQDFSDFDTAGLIRFREEGQHFAGERYEDFYSRWKALDSLSLGGTPQSVTAFHAGAQRQFSTFLLEHDYGLFGTLTHEFHKRRNGKTQTQHAEERFGAAFALSQTNTEDREMESHGQEPGQRR